MAGEAGFNLAQTLRAGQLPVQKRDKRIETLKVYDRRNEAFRNSGKDFL